MPRSFRLLDQVLIQSLPVANPDQLAVLSAYDPKDGPDIDGAFSYSMYKDLRDRNSAFSGVIARGGTQMNVSYGDQTERVRGELGQWKLFRSARSSSVGRKVVHAGRRSHTGWTSRRGVELFVLGKQVQQRSEHHRQDDPG